MTIHVTCECGRQLQSPDEYAGRQAICPICQRAMTLPNREGVVLSSATGPAIVTAISVQPLEDSQKASKVAPQGRSTLEAENRGIATNRMPNHRRVAIGLVVGFLGCMAVACMLVPAVHRGREPAVRIHSVNNLKQIGLACHNYYDEYEHFPAENQAADLVEPSKLSWRVQILPFIEQESLYDEFHHDEPWDSPHNIKLLPRMPMLYVDPRFPSGADRKKGLTFYRGFVGPQSVFGANRPPTLGDITNKNGASNTVLVVEAGEPVAWTKPEDPDFDENSPLGGPKRANFAALFADGHVQVLSKDFDRKMIGRMINWQNMEPVLLP